ncbi:PepSY_like domain-containing protein [Brevibacillus sp. IT-7CA2]
MLIEVTGHFTDEIILHGKKHEILELKNMVAYALEQSEQTSDFPHVFCKLFNFELIPYSPDIKVDVVFDTDTHRIYQPFY